jgi:hypothetical protein
MNKSRFSLAVALIVALPLAAQDGTRYSTRNLASSTPPNHRPGRFAGRRSYWHLPRQDESSLWLQPDCQIRRRSGDRPSRRLRRPQRRSGPGHLQHRVQIARMHHRQWLFQEDHGSRHARGHAGWTNEIAIDTQWAHAIAPAAKIILVEAKSDSNTDLYAAVDLAVANGATMVSMSWGGGEASDEATSIPTSKSPASPSSPLPVTPVTASLTRQPPPSLWASAAPL